MTNREQCTCVYLNAYIALVHSFVCLGCVCVFVCVCVWGGGGMGRGDLRQRRPVVCVEP